MLKKRERNVRMNLWITLILAIVFLQAFSVNVHAEKNGNYETWLQTIYTRENGLAAGEANDIETTSDGIIWVGTYAGLYRHNGSRFELMSQYDSVKNVNCLYVDDKDRLWVGTNDNGISVFQDEKLVGKIDFDSGLPSDSVRSIVKSSDGQYYVGTSDSMAILDFSKEIKVVKTIHKIQYADDITADQEGNVVAISSYGTMFLLRNGNIVRETILPGEDCFTSCVFGNDKNLHVGTASGYLYVYNLSDSEFDLLVEKDCQEIGKVNNLIRLNQDALFVCADHGIGYFDAKNKFHMLRTPNFTSSIENVIMDYQGNLWFTSSRMGLLRLCKTNFIELFTEYSINTAVTNTTERFDKKLYIGTDTGLVIIDEASGKEVKNDMTRQFENIRIRQIFKDSNNHLWFCTYGKGLAEFDGESIKYYNGENSQIGSRTRTIIERSNGELLVSSENGVTFIRDGVIEKTLSEKDGLKNQISLCMLEKSDGTILIGSDGGGITQIVGDKMSTIGKEQGMSSNVILRMVEDNEGDGVFVVTSNSLCYLHADETVQVLNHFPYSNNYDIIQQKDNIFVLSSAGVYVVLREELLANREDMKYTFLDDRAGLHNALVANSWILHEKEKVYLATSSGVTMFDLKAYNERPTDFKVRVESIIVDGENKLVESEETFSFSKKIHRLEIKPEIINYSTVDPIISCYLKGFDKNPITMPQSELSSIVYTNLPAGKYTFHINLVDSESGVPISEKVYRLERETAFYETVWFYIIVIGGIVLIATWIVVFILRQRIRAKEEELEKTWKISITDELTGLKNRFAMRKEFPGYVGKSITITMMDIDYFKTFNDSYGHEMGDSILKSVSNIILKYYSDSKATAFRFGGDEFLLLDSEGEEKDAMIRLKAMEEEICKTQIEGCTQPIHVSYGSVFGTPDNEEELRKMKNEADAVLYQVKRNRKKRV